MNWTLKKFEQLTPAELYSILQLRIEVFIVEQDCVFQDADGKDQLSYHFMAMEGDQLLAYSRILPPKLTFQNASIGRIITAPNARGTGLGRELVKRSIEELQTLFGNVPVEIGAQQHLDKFYGSFGFEIVGDAYVEDGIPHVHMIRRS